MSRQLKIEVGSLVAFNKLPDAVWFEVLRKSDFFGLIIREAGTDYAEQYADVSMVKQVKDK